MACYDFRVEKKRIEALALMWEKNTGQKTVVVEHLTGTRKWYTFEVIAEGGARNSDLAELES